MIDFFENSSSEQGDWGELQIKVKLKKVFSDETEHYIFNDVYLKCDDWVYQIDHVFICPNGVFVIETKMIQGLVLGNEKLDRWICYPSKDQALNIYNPIRQNDSHVKALNNYLNSYKCESIVIFANNNKPKGCPDFIVNKRDLCEYIRNYKPEKHLSRDDMLIIKNKLNDLSMHKIELKRIHNKQIKNYNKDLIK